MLTCIVHTRRRNTSKDMFETVRSSIRYNTYLPELSLFIVAMQRGHKASTFKFHCGNLQSRLPFADVVLVKKNTPCHR